MENFYNQMNKQITDISVSFQTKTHSIEQIEDRFAKYKIECGSKIKGRRFLEFTEMVSIPELGEHSEIPTEKDTTINHCFLPLKKLEKEGRNTDVYEVFMDQHAESHDVKCWNKDDSLYSNRVLMFSHILQTDGCAFFIGDLIDGVKEEYDMACLILEPHQIIHIEI